MTDDSYSKEQRSFYGISEFGRRVTSKRELASTRQRHGGPQIFAETSQRRHGGFRGRSIDPRRRVLLSTLAAAESDDFSLGQRPAGLRMWSAAAVAAGTIAYEKRRHFGRGSV